MKSTTTNPPPKKTLDELIQELNERWQGKKRRLVVKTDGFGHSWTEWEEYQEK